MQAQTKDACAIETIVEGTSMPRLHRIVAGAIALCVAACDSSPTDSIETLPASIRAFLKSEASLAIRSGAMILENRSSGVAVFRVEYGEALDCPSGCFFASAVGLQAGGRVGWVESVRQSPATPLFRLEPRDSARFSPTLLDVLQADDFRAYRLVAFALACAPNTIATVRQRIVRDFPALNAPAGCPA